MNNDLCIKYLYDNCCSIDEIIYKKIFIQIKKSEKISHVKRFFNGI